MNLTIKQKLEQAVFAHKKGNFSLAERIYRDILKSNAYHSDANHNLALIFLTNNKINKALKLFKTALDINPNIEIYWSSYIETLINENYFDVARQFLSKGKDKVLSEKTFIYLKKSLEKASLNISPPKSKTNNLINYFQKGKYDEAEVIALSINKDFPDHPFSWKVLGGIYLAKSKFQQAYNFSYKYILLNSNDPEGYNNLAVICTKLYNLNEAKTNYKKALVIKPDYFLALYGLGDVYRDLGKFKEAEIFYKKSLLIEPKHSGVHNSLGHVQKKSGNMEDAEINYRAAISLRPNFPMAYNNLGNLLFRLRKWNDSINSYKKAISLDPSYAVAHNNKNYNLLFLNELSQEEIYNEHLQFDKQFYKLKIKNSFNFPVDNNPYKKIKIGYVSADFRNHSVAYFFEPLLRNHNTDKVETFCYYNNNIIDKTTKRLMKFSNNWRSIYNVSDEKVVNIIRKDKIDILVDLAGHTRGNRLLVFAYKAVPVQITYLGYPCTTGLSAIDYRFTDKIADPEGASDKYHSETLIRLPNGFLCYEGNKKIAVNSNLPMKKNRMITFGSFNNLFKITPDVVNLWSKILHAIPEANLLLKSGGIEDNLDVYVDLFKNENIDASRIKIFSRIEKTYDHLRLYDKIDIGLDPFPYNGTTTTFEALWMGVPVITLLGKSHVSRVGASILHKINLSNFVAQNKKDYLNLAIMMSKKIKYLESIRKNLRTRMINSHLTNEISFARDIEDSYQKVWSKYVKQQSLKRFN